MSKEIDLVEMIGFFLVIPDPRGERGKEHKLIDIIVIALCGVMWGVEGWSERSLGKIRRGGLRNFWN